MNAPIVYFNEIAEFSSFQALQALFIKQPKNPMEPLYLGIPLSDWFDYHPPLTEYRKAKHEAVNNISLFLAQNIGCMRWDEISKSAIAAIIGLFDNPTKESTVKAIKWILNLRDQLNAEPNPDNKMMLIQQIRMFANQAVTFENL